MNTESVNFTETIDGRKVEMFLVETWDGLYAPIGVVRPEGDGPFPIVLLASGNGGEGIGWLRNAFQNRSHIIDRLVEAGYAAAWLRYRTEVELGYNNGGPMVRDKRQGREMFNRSPLEYEDEIAVTTEGGARGIGLDEEGITGRVAGAEVERVQAPAARSPRRSCPPGAASRSRSGS